MVGSKFIIIGEEKVFVYWVLRQELESEFNWSHGEILRVGNTDLSHWWFVWLVEKEDVNSINVYTFYPELVLVKSIEVEPSVASRIGDCTSYGAFKFELISERQKIILNITKRSSFWQVYDEGIIQHQDLNTFYNEWGIVYDNYFIGRNRAGRLIVHNLTTQQDEIKFEIEFRYATAGKYKN